MTLLNPSGFDPEDERLSRYLDDDLSAEERAVLEAALRQNERLEQKLAGLEEAVSLVAGSIEPPPQGFADAAIDRALDAFDHRTDRSEDDDPAPARGTAEDVVAPLRPRIRRWARPTTLALSVAAALLAVVAVGAVLTLAGGDSASDGSTAMEAVSPEFDTQRNPASVSAEAGAADSSQADQTPLNSSGERTSTSPSSTTASSYQAASPTYLGSFASVQELLDALSARALQGDVQPPATTTETSNDPEQFDCALDLPGTATVAGLPVRWGVRGSGTAGDPTVFVVIDAQDCSLLGQTSA